MSIRLLMGNGAIAEGALAAGVTVATGYPGTPSTEILETIAKIRDKNVYVEWSVNEKAALEVAAGASYAGHRTLVTMKQVGLNVASDPLMSLAYIGVKGGMVVVVADDPGPISSQTEQDTRTFARYSKLPIFDPASPEEAYAMIRDAFDYSEKYSTPVLFRPTTRLSHANAAIDATDERDVRQPEGFVKDPKWVIFPRLSYAAHKAIEERNPAIGEDFSSYRFNTIEGNTSANGTRLGIATGGVSYAYTREALQILGADCRILKIATPYPFPETLAARFLNEVDTVLVLEELDPVIERELIYLCGKLDKSVKILGKGTRHTITSGENSVETVTEQLASFLNCQLSTVNCQLSPPSLPIRPPVLCAGCPHRASFYAVKKAMHGKKAIFSGDIGCYTLGNAQPLDMVDTCLCMGAGITLAQGLSRAEPDATVFAFVGDSTFFASGMTGVVNAVYNKHDMVLVVLDNRITAMTGGQTHPGIGKTLMNEPVPPLNIPAILTAFGITPRVVNPLDHKAAVAAVNEAAAESGVRAIVFEYPCVNVAKPTGCASVDADKCIACGKCVRELGCPALSIDNGQLTIDNQDEKRRVTIDKSLCTGCGLCAQMCPTGAIAEVSE
ncbi:MAG: indolepyruvate ferredoxin oxidoreductase subunit alpha [Oscillospiraceae bacterium]|jgi:indolepyruvate ferredoxin oxidoreductase alpha subunit|nr:indolepyruvate ferredoxin oxidoreductase subunit alpha [Oscillospiraceae bacterium]